MGVRQVYLISYSKKDLRYRQIRAIDATECTATAIMIICRELTPLTCIPALKQSMSTNFIITGTCERIVR